MVRKIRRLRLLAVLLSLVSASGLGCGRPVGRLPSAPPKNVILLIGDGMGFEHIKAAGLYANGREGSLFMETLPYRAEVVTTSVPAPNATRGARPPITDSAAAATAMATGHKVYNGVLSVARPGDGAPYPTVLESFAAHGKMTGIVSNAVITDATPAAFASHTAARGNAAEIVACYLRTVRPNVIMGGRDASEKAKLTPDAITAAGYQIVANRQELAALNTSKYSYVFGLFGKGNMPYEVQKAAAATQPAQADLLMMPSLSEMAGAALKIVSSNRKGFFLMVEGALIDKSANRKGQAQCIPEVVEFDRAVKVVMDWARRRRDTLVIVVADHETGGLTVGDSGARGQLPTMTWSSGHTARHVPLFAWGIGADKIRGVLDNTDVYRLMMGTFSGSSAAPQTAPAGASAHLLRHFGTMAVAMLAGE